MRRSRITAAVAALLLALAVVLGGLSAPAPSVSATAVPLISFHPILTIKPIITIWLSDAWMTVDIPDPKLSQALHAQLGIPLATALTRGDLYSLNGALVFTNYGIKDLTGIQFCKNITTLNLYGNPIETVPSLSGMAGLQKLNLAKCGLSTVPAAVGTLPHLSEINLGSNGIQTMPPFLTGMHLKSLLIDDNALTEIPTGFGAAGLVSLSIARNKLTSIPDDLLSAGTFGNLDIVGNRLTSLPAKVKTHLWGQLYVEFNFLDVSAGSADHAILTGLTATECYYERQCTPLRNLVATPASDSIRLTWDKSPDSSGPGWTLKASHYLVYLVEGSDLTELAILGPDATEYLDEGLAPLVDRRYYVGVEYAVSDFGDEFQTRSYVTLDAKTLAAPTATPEPTPTVEPTAGATATPTPGGGTSGLPTWLILAGIGVLVLGIAVVVGAVVLVVKLAKPKKPAPPAPPAG